MILSMMKMFRTFSVLFLVLTISVSAQNIQEYKSKEGETLKEIADKFGVGYISLIKMNKGVSRRPATNTLIKIPENVFSRPQRPRDFRVENKSDLILVKTIDSIKVHKVKPKETLYSLSKQYRVSMSKLIKENAFLAKEGLKIGQELKIPTIIIKQNGSEAKFVKTHIVLAKETLYSISNKYSITIDELKDNNVEVLSDGVRVGDVLEIPHNEIKIEKVNNKEHKILKGETLYAISRKYGISVPELLSVNKTVTVDSLKIGSVINLPHRVVKAVRTSTVAPIFKEVPVKYAVSENENIDSILNKFTISKDSLKSINPDLDSLLISGGEVLLGFEKRHLLFEQSKFFNDSLVKDQFINAMLLLPFDFNKTDSLSATTLFSSANGLPNMVADFYMGAQIAVDSLRKQGVRINFTVIDTEKSVDSLHKKLDTIKSYDPDVILGPLYTSNTTYIASKFPKTPVYYPIYSKNQKTFNASNIVKTATDRSLFKKEIISYIAENRKGEHLLIVGLSQNIKKLKELKSKLIKRDLSGGPLSNDVTILALPKEYVAKEDFLAKLKLEKDNWVLVAENSNVITADVFNNAKSVPKDSILDTPIRILSFEKSKYAQDNLSYKKLAKFHYTYATDQVEYNDVLSNVFNNTYLSKNGAYPSDFSNRGFSVTYDAILRALKQGYDDEYKASHRNTQAFYYDRLNAAKNENQAVFVNAIENKKGELKIIRLR